jgi:hypothetical protein
MSNELTSPSGKYRLEIESKSTKPGCWDCTTGRVYAGDKLIIQVDRNYSSFPFMWMENHANGHSYLICGADYQGQTFIELDTGKRRDHLPEEAKDGHGFCWGSYRLLDDKTLLVDGCYWAWPYELKFFDVSDPMAGWPEIKLPEGMDYLDPGKSEVKAHGNEVEWLEYDYIFKATGEHESEVESKWHNAFSEAQRVEVQEVDADAAAAAQRAFAAHQLAYPCDHEEKPERWERVVNRRLRLAVEDGKFVVVSRWTSDWQIRQDKANEKCEVKMKAQQRQWRDDDALFQHLSNQHDIESGYMYPSQMDKWEGDVNPIYLRVYVRPDEDKPTRTATIQWGVAAGSITVELWVRGEGRVGEPEFERGIEGIDAAWSTAKTHISS